MARLRPPVRQAFLRLHTFPAEQAQVDWAHFGHVAVGRAKRALSCFVMTLSYSRALYLEFFFDQTMENFLRGHVRAFQHWGGAPRVILYLDVRFGVDHLDISLDRGPPTLWFGFWTVPRKSPATIAPISEQRGLPADVQKKAFSDDR